MNLKEMRCTYGEIGRKMENFVRMSVEDLAMSKLFSNFVREKGI